MPTPSVALVLYPHFSPFHIAVPYAIFGATLPNEHLFDLQFVSTGEASQRAERSLTVQPDGGLELLERADIIVVPGWHDLGEPPAAELIAALRAAHARGARLVGLCYGAYALAYSGLLDGRQAATHWLAEADFTARFPRVQLDTNALYVEDGNLITSAGTAAGLDCCLFLVRRYHGVQAANRLARIMVIPPHREGGQAQFIEQPVARSTQDARINQLLDYLRENLATQHQIDDLAQHTAMSRRSFTRHFQKATGLSVGQWLTQQRIQRSRELLETTRLPIEQIAELLGYQSATAFRQQFKQLNQVSPRAWRRTFVGV